MAHLKPKVTDTEHDLLELQEKFFRSGERPSASLAGEKRKTKAQQPAVRDVVTLKEGEPPRAKKSKFRERRERLAKKTEGKWDQDPHAAMESQDTHITKLLSDIQDHGLLGTPPSRTAGATKHGFPVVPTVDLDLLTLKPADTKTRPAKRGKSLFAQMFEEKGPGFFGMASVSSPEDSLGMSIPHGGRDYVEPVAIRGEETRDRSRDMEVEATPVDLESSGEKSPKRGYASAAAATWDNFRSSLISGEGLASESEDTVRSELGKIHQENVKKLSSLSEAELLQEKEQIEKALGPKLVEFVKKSRHKEHVPPPAAAAATKEDVSSTSPKPTVGLPTGGPAPDLPTGGSTAPTPTPLVPPGGWLHMDVVEREKMEWMTDVPPPAPDTKLDKMEARFSLEGLVIPRGVDIPSHLGLHHHGDEPQAAGYTLGELLPLCRSSVLQQRVLSIQTLSRILRRARQREYEGAVQESVTERLCEADAPLLLRYAVCEDTEQVVMAAVQALHALLVPTADQVLLEEYGLCYSGHRLPSLGGREKPVARGRKGEGEGEEGEGESESELFQRDMVEGFLKMSLLPRVRYLLEVFLVQAPLNIRTQLLAILTRVARHSTGAASQILNCPRLMQVVFEQYLPLAWSGNREGAEEGAEPSQVGMGPSGWPQVEAVNLVRAMCVAGRNIASQLISKYSLLSVVTCYAVLHPSELNLPTEEAYPLAVASLGVWQVLLSYGLGDEAFRDTLPVYLKQLHHLTTVTDLPSSGESRRVAALLHLTESAICLAAVTPDQLRLAAGEGGEGGWRQLPAPSVQWGHVEEGFVTPLVHALVTWTRANAGRTPDQHTLLVMGGLLNTVATYYHGLKRRAGGGSPVGALEQVETVMTSVVGMLSTSSFLSTLLEVMKEGHHLDSTTPTPDTSPPALPSHFSPPVPPHRAVYGQAGGGAGGGANLQPYSVFMRSANFLVGVARLCLACVQLHKGGGVVGGVSWMFTNAAYRQCLWAAATGKGSSPVRFLKAEMVRCTLKLFLSWMEAGGAVGDEVLQFFHHLSFNLFISLPHGADHTAHDLLSTVLFHPTFYSTALNSTVATREVYERTLGLQTRLYSPVTCQSQLFGKRGGLVPSDWVFLPVMVVYNASLQAHKELEFSAMDIHSIGEMLSYLLLLEQRYPFLLSHLSLATKVARLMCFFLLGDLFLEESLRVVLRELTQLYCCPEALVSLDLAQPIPGLYSFRDLYTSLLEHFSAASYGDHLFSCFVLIPLQQRLPAFFRKLVWEEHPQVLRILSIPMDQLPMDVNLFLHPVETDEVLIERYLCSLATDVVRKKWSPLMYRVAVHHVKSLISSGGESASPINPLQKKLLSSILCIKDEVVRTDLLEK